MKRNKISTRTPLAIITIISIGVIIFFVPPIDQVRITLGIFLVGFFSFLICQFFLPKKISLATGGFVFVALFLRSVHLLDLMNLILLTSLFVGVFILLK